MTPRPAAGPRPGRAAFAPVLAPLSVLGLVLAALFAAPPAAATTVNVARVSGGINPAIADYLMDAIERSAEEDVEALVIALDTPGGLLSSTKDIVSAILNADVPVIVFVSPRGAWAASAGTFITLAGHIAAMAPGTSIGAAHPVSVTGGSPKPPQPPTTADDDDDSGDDGAGGARGAARDHSAEKIENFSAAFIESIAETRDRNVEWAVDAVRNSVAIKQSEALEKGVVDLGAEDLEHLLELVHGREVKVGREKRTLDTADAQLVDLPMSWLNRIFAVIADPQIAVLLFLAGAGGLYIELQNPGLIVPGAVGVVCLILAGLAFQIIPFNWIGLILMVAGVGLLIAEVFVSGFGVLFSAGLVSFGLGAWLVFRVPEVSDFALPLGSFVLPVVGVLGAFGLLIVFAVGRSFARPQVAGSEGMIGKVGRADTDLAPEGRIVLRGELWSARADHPIERGEPVEVVGFENLALHVRPVGEAAPAEPASQTDSDPMVGSETRSQTEREA